MSVELFAKHRDLLDKVLAACHSRESFTAYAESPSSRIHGKELPAEGKQRFDACLGQQFELDMPGQTGWIGNEVSPFTREPLGITYPRLDVESCFAATRAATPAWRDASVEQRMGVCLEMLHRNGEALALFVNAHATMHTAGQSYIMAFAGCGANALDRGLEALAYAWKAMQDGTTEATWRRGVGGPEKSIRALDADFLLENMRINTLPTLLLAKHFSSALKKSPAPLLATISARVGSIEDNRLGGWYSYRMSKAALNMALKTLSIEWKHSHPRGCVAALHPGTNDSPLSKPFQANVAAPDLFDPKDTAVCFLRLLRRLNAGDSGKFWTWDGATLSW